MNQQKGSAIITTPLVIAMGMMLIAMLLVSAIKIILPYIWYEKLSSVCMKYVFVLEEYGYLTKKEGKMLLDDLEKQGFQHQYLHVDYTSKKVKYGEEIFLKVDYEYSFQLPGFSPKIIPMKVEKYSICKR